MLLEKKIIFEGIGRSLYALTYSSKASRWYDAGSSGGGDEVDDADDDEDDHNCMGVPMKMMGPGRHWCRICLTNNMSTLRLAM